MDGVPYHRLLPWIMPGRMDRLYQAHLRRAARLTERLRPAVLHAASNYANAVIALALRDATGLPVVYEVRGFWEDTWLSRHAANADLKLSDRYVRTRALETHCMTDADLVVTLGEAMREEIIARGVPAEKVIIVPNGVSEEFLRPLPDGAALRASLGIQPGEHVVGLVSSLVAHEGIGTLLEAVKLLGDRGVRTRALIVGDGPERTALQRQAAELGLDAIFTGRVPSARVRDYHAVLDVFVVPRTPDRVCQLVTPLKPVEAMASGLPVVVSSVRALSRDRAATGNRPAVPPARRRRARGPAPAAPRQPRTADEAGRERPGSGSPATAPGRTTRPATARYTEVCCAETTGYVREGDAPSPAGRLRLRPLRTVRPKMVDG